MPLFLISVQIGFSDQKDAKLGLGSVKMVLDIAIFTYQPYFISNQKDVKIGVGSTKKIDFDFAIFT